MENLKGMSTETRNSATMNLDQFSVREILLAMNQEDSKVPAAIDLVIPDIELAVNAVDAAFKKGGRLIYIGAGTSGRLGILDAVECVPTFGTSPEMVQGLIAGGEEAMMRAVEGAEDNTLLAQSDLQALNLSDKDVVIGIAASGRTPYVLGGLTYAKQVGATTVSLACNAKSKIGDIADIRIEVIPGPEVLTGSTRLKAGTAQKLVLNMISTAAMIKQGKVYQNLMVDVIATNDKLKQRCENIVQEATGASDEQVKEALAASHGEVKIAIIMLLIGLSYEEAKEQLAQANGYIRKVINE
ncbi:N-acetylmuramic acid 6-phosphate etherase [Aerococcaceae bacterium zg-ZJ1578]|uniref:N-acetylmuramic acid 6-phosphate etherase n=1 Tax=Aerococcaceae TaxID=186827 RepID=UPI0013B6DE5A|nr:MULTISPECIES: N-acetylmuramic acid 6-phosphate etherase [unclassified Facklamia]MBK0347146.1 N-acetylmuramic acid 6-phosphate etherase [Aerococcaceae bacterium zg-1578]NEW64632.1 N-acetylmuramic acid 6-phosphate etherase [Facklamia sp. 252]NEW67957.1 N-acetylmuramic acid 6-phosphate etherase [Facklamia sp. 253]QQD65445.1 N-acetylmuramic acid 6-phosphate etherase [Aerococcaceae bacterium zg-252]